MGSGSAAKYRHSGHHSPAKYSATWRPAKRLHSTRAPLWFRTEAPENRHCCGCVGAAKVDSRHNIVRRPRRDRHYYAGLRRDRRRSGRLAALPKRSQRRREALRARPRRRRTPVAPARSASGRRAVPASSQRGCKKHRTAQAVASKCGAVDNEDQAQEETVSHPSCHTLPRSIRTVDGSDSAGTSRPLLYIKKG